MSSSPEALGYGDAVFKLGQPPRENDILKKNTALKCLEKNKKRMQRSR